MFPYRRWDFGAHVDVLPFSLFYNYMDKEAEQSGCSSISLWLIFEETEEEGNGKIIIGQDFRNYHSAEGCVCMEFRFSQNYNNNALFIAFQYTLDLF